MCIRDRVLTLYFIKNKSSKSYNTTTIDSLKTKGLINTDSQGVFTLPQHYYAYKRIENQKIGPYIISDIRNFVTALGNNEARSIGIILDQYKDTPNRSQIKYLITKLLADKIIISIGQKKGTKYLFHERFRNIQDTNALAESVVHTLKEIYQ